jgi:Uma2 family endonuclease
MCPAPNSFHQDYSMNLTFLLGKIFRKSSCKMYVVPFNVRSVNHSKSSVDKEVLTVVQPDLCVICDRNKIDEKGCLGAPDLIIEILSKGNSKKEMDIKFDLYEENGVREYWIVNPTDEAILIYVLQNGKFIGHKPLTTGNELHSPTFEKLHFSIKNVFDL